MEECEVEPFLLRMKFELRTPRYSSSEQVKIFEDYSLMLCHFASRHDMSSDSYTVTPLHRRLPVTKQP